MTTIVLGAVGAAAGFAIGGPFGAALGWTAGAGLGSMLDRPTIQGPRLTDLKLQGSSYGAFVPITYGAVRLAGNVIWQTDLVEHSQTSGGKGGGGPKQKTYSYTASFDVKFCESNGKSINRLWAYGRLIYSASAGIGLNDVPVVFYDGNPTQLPDPTEEADKGVGLTPAYRGVLRAVFNDWNLAQFSNQIPMLEAEIKTAPESGLIRQLYDLKQDPPWDNSLRAGEWDTNWDALPAINASAKAPASVVYFKAGYQWAASQIATALGLSQKSLTPLGSQVPALGAQSDDVVVVLGPDIAIKG